MDATTSGNQNRNDPLELFQAGHRSSAQGSPWGWHRNPSQGSCAEDSTWVLPPCLLGARAVVHCFLLMPNIFRGSHLLPISLQGERGWDPNLQKLHHLAKSIRSSACAQRLPVHCLGFLGLIYIADKQNDFPALLLTLTWTGSSLLPQFLCLLPSFKPPFPQN